MAFGDFEKQAAALKKNQVIESFDSLLKSLFDPKIVLKKIDFDTDSLVFYTSTSTNREQCITIQSKEKYFGIPNFSFQISSNMDIECYTWAPKFFIKASKIIFISTQWSEISAFLNRMKHFESNIKDKLQTGACNRTNEQIKKR